MDWNTVSYRIRTWLRHQMTAKNTSGHGVHSPYLFEWVNMVMSDTNGFYAWDAIEKVRAKMLIDEQVVEFVDYGKERGRDCRRVCDIAKGSLAKKKYAEMLARLVDWLGRPLLTSPSRGGIGDGRWAIGDRRWAMSNGLIIVELGTSLGVTTAYMAAMDTRNKVITYEGCPAVAAIAKANWQALGLKNVDCRVGEIDVEALARDIDRLDVAFIDANHTYASTRAYFNVLATKVHGKSVIVVDDIHHSEEMERAWKAICEDERVTSTMDLYQMGLVFFDVDYWKRNYRMKV